MSKWTEWYTKTKYRINFTATRGRPNFSFRFSAACADDFQPIFALAECEFSAFSVTFGLGLQNVSM